MTQDTERAAQANYVVLVSFRVLPEHAAEFARLLMDNAAASRALEPACRVFDVCRWPGDDTRLFLYELYDDEAAFQAHLAMPHFKAFDAAVNPWVVEKSVQVLRKL